MLKGKCNVCHKGKSTIAKQFAKKKSKKKTAKTTPYKSKRTGPISIKITKTKPKKTARRKKGGFLATALPLIPDIAGGLTNLIKKKPAPHVGWTRDPLYFKRHDPNNGRCLHPSDEVCDLYKAKKNYMQRQRRAR